MKTKVFLFSMLTLLGCIAIYGQEFTVDGIKYNVLSEDDYTCEVARNNNVSGDIVLPMIVTNPQTGTKYSVAQIGASAFIQNYNLNSIVIPKSITRIRNYAFGYCYNLTSLHIPASVIDIEANDAFYSCYGLLSIVVDENNPKYDSRLDCNALINSETNELMLGCRNTYIPNTVTKIGANAFLACRALTSINIPSSVTCIDRGAFYWCSGLTKIKFSNTLQSIGNQAFQGCTGLTSLSIPASLTSIGETYPSMVDNPFAECSNISEITVDPNNPVFDSRESCNAIIRTNTNELILGCNRTTIPSSIESIGYAAFASLSQLESIEIPEGVKKIGPSAFSKCTNLVNLVLPNSLKEIGEYAFQNCDALLNLNIPEGVEIIKSSSFYSCDNLQSVAILQNVESIGDWAFGDCPSLTSITLPNTLTKIGNYAFSGCTGFTSITIPDGVTRIGNYAFKGCSNLSKIIIKNLTPPSMTTNYNQFSEIASNAVIYVPNKSLDNYKTASGWSDYASIIQPFYTLTYQAKYNGEILKSATVDAFYGDDLSVIPDDLKRDFVVLNVDENTPATVSDDHVIDCNVTWNGPFQFSTSEEDATWYNLKIRLDKYMYVNETEPYYGNADATPRELATAEYQWAFGGNPYDGIVMYNRSTGFSKSMTPANGFNSRSAVVLRDGDYKWNIGQMYYELEDGTYRPDFNLSVTNGEEKAFINEYAKQEMALWVTDNYWDIGNRLTISPAPSPNWVSGANVNGIAGNKVTVPVSLDNQDGIAGVQFDLLVPSGITLTNVSTTSRTSKLMVDFEKRADNLYRVLLFQTGINAISGNEGKILNLTLDIDDNLALGEYTIRYNDVVLTKSNSEIVATANSTSKLTLVDIELGDANRDGQVNVADIVATANHILGRTPAKFSEDAADVNGDGQRNVADIVGIANLILRSSALVKSMAVEPQ